MNGNQLADALSQYLSTEEVEAFLDAEWELHVDGERDHIFKKIGSGYLRADITIVPESENGMIGRVEYPISVSGKDELLDLLENANRVTIAEDLLPFETVLSDRTCSNGHAIPEGYDTCPFC